MTSNESSPDHPESEDALVKRARGGDRSAFERLIDRHGPDLLRYVTRLTHDTESALDVFQDSFFRAFRSLTSLREPGMFRTWVASIATNIVRKRLRQAKNELLPLREEPPDTALADVSVQAHESAGKDLLRASIEELPARQRAVLSLRLEVGLPFQKIGDVLGISEENARSHHYQALKNLRRRMPQFVERDDIGDRT